MSLKFTENAKSGYSEVKSEKYSTIIALQQAKRTDSHSRKTALNDKNTDSITQTFYLWHKKEAHPLGTGLF